jgi:biotin carboxyl carrier protein
VTADGELDEFALRELVRAFVPSDIRRLVVDTGRVRLELAKAGPAVPVDRPITPEAVAAGPSVERSGEALATVDVTAPSVGVVRWSGNGHGRPAVGREIPAGAQLGVLAVLDAEVSVVAPATGRLAELLVDDGVFVEYGQVLARLEAPAA